MVAVDPGPTRITIANSPERTVEVHRKEKSPGGTHTFRGLDDKEYRWQPSSRLWVNNLEVRGWLY